MNTPDDKKRCHNCQFFDNTLTEGSVESPIGMGNCLRYPPVLGAIVIYTEDEVENAGLGPDYDVLPADRNRGFWVSPSVGVCFWCGEWKEIEVKP